MNDKKFISCVKSLPVRNIYLYHLQYWMSECKLLFCCVQALVSKLPRKTGYFQEMRSAMPQIIYSGAHELAFDIFLGFQLRSRPAAAGAAADSTGYGTFMVRSLVRSGADAQTCVRYIVRFALAYFSVNNLCFVLI